MRPIAPLFLLAATLAATLNACGPYSQHVELRSAKARWSQQSLQDYAFEYTRSCECALAGVVLQVSVQGGAVTEVKRKDTGATLKVDEYGSVPTIQELFDKLERASLQAEEWSATFDAARGYPRTVSIDWRKAVADDEAVETVSALTPK